MPSASTARADHDLALALRTGRARLGITQQQLSVRAKVSRHVIAELETSYRRACADTYLPKLAQIVSEVRRFLPTEKPDASTFAEDLPVPKDDVLTRADTAGLRHAAYLVEAMLHEIKAELSKRRD
jgi:transcriptional regulator with XRE-family HTH domain